MTCSKCNLLCACGNTARYLDTTGKLCCSLCPLKEKVNSISLSDVPALIEWILKVYADPFEWLVFRKELAAVIDEAVFESVEDLRELRPKYAPDRRSIATLLRWAHAYARHNHSEHQPPTHYLNTSTLRDLIGKDVTPFPHDDVPVLSTSHDSTEKSVLS